MADQTTGPGFARPAADTIPDLDYLAMMKSSGATSYTWTTADKALNAGTSFINVYFRARKNINKSFADGTYSAVVVIRCE
ncbi:MAG: hypothetical protein U5K75_11340 [Ahrensia sp.]|nr:hypothetical protein [Ahrensia sp.]